MADNEEYSRDAGSADIYSETGDTISNVEWRSVEQVENGTPSTSPFWDTDSDEDGPKPSELYGKHTWKIENFSKINGRELRSEPFDAGGYKWYILIYPKGCDVCNHISLFLCVANHDKLLPGWSHFAQFTIAVVNNDQKKSKYSDTLHRFWKKEHDWGWKKFMELSKVQEGFLVDGNLVIKAQVQVIREKADRPFRCLDRLYRRELVRIYMTNIENIYRKFVEEKRNRLSKLIEDKSRWASFHGFWSGTSVSVKNCMSRERSDVILKIIVKHFFIEKEVTSTLVMDSLYSGLRALELQSIKGKKWRGSMPSELEMMPPLMVRVDRDMFVLADDVITLLERVVLEPVPPVKDDKVSQNRTTKDGTTIDEMSRDTNERDERRLTEIGRRILEIFTLAHIYSIIEVAYQEAIALKRQEELIREEEAWMNEPDTKSKRDNKDKKSKKKQGKQKKNNKKGKEKEKEEKPIVEDPPEETEELNEDGSENGEDVTNGDDASNGGELLAEPEAVDLEVQESNPVNKDYEITKDEWTGKKSYGSSSINNDNWVPVGSSNKGMNSSNYKNHSSPNRGKTQRNKSVNERPTPLPIVTNINEKMGPTHLTVPTLAANSNVTPGTSNDSGSSNGRARTPQPKQKLEQRIIETQPIISMQKKVEPKSQPQPQPQIVFMAPSKPATPTGTPSSATLNPSTKPFIPFKPTPSSSTPRPVLSSATFPVASPRPVGPPPSPKREPVNPLPKGPIPFTPIMQTRVMPEPVNPVKNMSSPRASSQASIVSRPLSAPVIVSQAGPRPVTPMVAPVQVSSYLTRSVSAMNRVGTDPSPSPSPSAPSFIPQSYRSAITGSNVNNNSNNNSLTGLNLNLNLNSHPNPIGFAIQGSLLQARLNSGMDMISGTGTGTESNLSFFSSSPSFNRPQHNENGPLYPDYSVPDSQTIAEEFPHMDIINDVLDGELYRPRDGTLGRSYHPFPVSRPELHLDSPIGLNRVDPLRDMGLTGGSSRVDQIRDMGLFSGSSQVGPYRDIGLTGRSSRVDPLRDMAHMGMTSGSSRVDSLRDMGLASGSALVEPMRDMSLASGSGRVDPLWETGMLNSRVYGSSSSSLRDGGHSSLFNNNVPSYHHVNGHYDYSNDLGMNLNMGVDLNNGYGIRDYSHLQGPSGLNRFRYPHDNGR